jgi:enoyl-CoA hydratase/carnithine racemase
MSDKVQLEIKAPVATITLNKPERLNALDLEMWEGIAAAAAAVDAAGAFCAGLDVRMKTGGLDG